MYFSLFKNGFKNNLLITKSSCDVKCKENFQINLVINLYFPFSLVGLLKTKNSLDGQFLVCYAGIFLLI